MSKPIAQSFYVNEPVGGVEGVILTKVELFFKNVSSTYGVELQIRTTENGFPTSYRLPEASKVLQVTDTHGNGAPVIVASDDASLPTIFEFDTPIQLQSQTSYSLVVIPVGGNPDYKIWTAELSATDVTTGTPIFTNNETGDLFLASNDRTFTPVTLEDFKFKLYIANFTANTGRAVFKFQNSENISYSNQTRPFVRGETVYMSEKKYNLAALNISSNTGAFTAGEVVYQSNGSANVATGLIYSTSNSSIIKIYQSSGSWNTAYEISGVTSLSNAVVTAVSQNVVTHSNTTIDVPFTEPFYANQTIYVGTNDRYTMNINKVVSVPNNTSISVLTDVEFSDSHSMIGKIRGDNASLYGFYKGPLGDNGFLTTHASLSQSTANSTVNFANSTGEYLIGAISRSSAVCRLVNDVAYNAIIPNYTYIQSQSDSINWSFKGIGNFDSIVDAAEVTILPGTDTELTDRTRMLMSRSNEYVYKSGDKTTAVYADFNTSNNKISPMISTYDRSITFTKNRVIPEIFMSGYTLTVSNFNNFNYIDGKLVSQNNGSYSVEGKIFYANSSVMHIASSSKKPFVVGNTVYLTNNTSVNAVVTSVNTFSEIYNEKTHPYGSRYISKTVILADQQDAEDLRCYLAAYRPAGTNLIVYSKIVNNQDPDSIKDKYWSRMIETPESSLLLSSGSNPDDFVELVYNFPTAVEIFANSVSCNTTSANVTVATTSGISEYDFVYLYDETNNKFIVRQVESVANNTTLVVNKTPTFASSNCKFGTIPNMEDASGSFLFPDNNNIVRYVSNNDVVYDGYKFFNIKILLVSNIDRIVPRAADMRCLALQV